MTAAASSHFKPAPLLPPKNDPVRRWVLALLCLVPPGVGLLALILGADASWDHRNYHWYNAWAYLSDRGGRDFMPSQGQFFLNPWLDVPFYLLATHLPLKCAFFLLGAVQGLNFPLLFMIAYATLTLHDTRRRAAAAAALAAAGLFSAIGISEIGAVFYDNVTSLGVLASLLLLLRRLDALQQAPEPAALRYAALSGLPAGLAAGLKMTSAPYCMGLCVALLVLTPQVRRSFLLSLAFGLGALAGFLAAYGHWGWYLATHYGSPTFPFFNIVFHSPLLPGDNLLLDFAPPHNWRILVFPFLFGVNPRLVNEAWWQDWRIPALYGLMLWLLIQYKAMKKHAHGGAIAEPLPSRFLLVWGAVGYYGWVLSETVYRYLMPLDMLAPLLIVICIGLLPLARRPRLIAAAAAVAALSLTIQPANWGRHATWPDEMAKVSFPPLSEKPHTLVLMAGSDAYAYLLPALPPELTYLRIESRGFPPDADTGLADLIRTKVGAHKGPLMLLAPQRGAKEAAKALAPFHLAIVADSCRTIADQLSTPALDRPDDSGNAYPPAYSLCSLTREKR